MKRSLLQIPVLLLAFSFTFLTYCGRPSSPTQSAQTEKTRLQDQLIMATLYVQHAAEYKALCFQAYRLARYRLDHLLMTSRMENPSIILDLDETVLDNSPYAAWQVLNDEAYSSATWKTWTDLAIADSIPGSLGFLKYADSRGVNIFYVSNRSIDALESTRENLEKLGYPQTEEGHIYLKTTTSSKAERRQEITEAGNTVLLYIGDNLGDLGDEFEKLPLEQRNAQTTDVQHRFGSMYIVLPNPTYGDWEGALYDYNYGISDAKKDSIRRSYLNGF